LPRNNVKAEDVEFILAAIDLKREDIVEKKTGPQSRLEVPPDRNTLGKPQDDLGRQGQSLDARAEADALIPEDTEVLLKANLRQIVDSALFRKFLPDIFRLGRQSADLRRFLGAAGINPLHDLDSITLASVGTNKFRALVVVRGHFDPDKINAALEAWTDNGWKVRRRDKQIIFENTSNPYPVYTTVPNRGCLVISTDETNLLQDIQNTEKAKLNSDLKAALDKIGGSESLWVAAVVTDEIKKAMQNNPQAQQFADKLQALTATLNITENIHLNVQIHTTDAKVANQLQTVVEGLKGLVEMFAQGNKEAGPELTEIARGIQVGIAGTTVAIDVKVSEDQLQKLVDLGKGVPK
jgi:hypothetical protein